MQLNLQFNYASSPPSWQRYSPAYLAVCLSLAIALYQLHLVELITTRAVLLMIVLIILFVGLLQLLFRSPVISAKFFRPRPLPLIWGVDGGGRPWTLIQSYGSAVDANAKVLLKLTQLSALNLQDQQVILKGVWRADCLLSSQPQSFHRQACSIVRSGLPLDAYRQFTLALRRGLLRGDLLDAPIVPSQELLAANASLPRPARLKFHG